MVELASAGAGLVCLLGAVAMLTLGGGHAPRIILALLLTGTASLAGTRLGGWLRSVTGAADALAANAAGQLTGQVIGGLLGMAAAALVAYGFIRPDVIQFGADRGTGRRGIPRMWILVAAATLPVLVVTIPGPLGQGLTNVINAIATVVGWLIAAPLGLA